jgi:hypothetical protein
MAIRPLLTKSVRFGYSLINYAIQARSLLSRALYIISLLQAQIARTGVDGLLSIYVTSLATERVNTIWLIFKDSSILKELLLDSLECALRDLRTILLRAQTIYNISTIIITVRNKLEADRLIAKGLHFGGYNHTVERYWEIGPTEICPKCLDYGHTSYRGCSGTPKCYICAGNHEANEYKCPITGCSTPIGKACIYLPIKCIHCKGPHFAISNSCPKRRIVIEEAKKKK